MINTTKKIPHNNWETFTPKTNKERKIQISLEESTGSIEEKTEFINKAYILGTVISSIIAVTVGCNQAQTYAENNPVKTNTTVLEIQENNQNNNILKKQLEQLLSQAPNLSVNNSNHFPKTQQYTKKTSPLYIIWDTIIKEQETIKNRNLFLNQTYKQEISTYNNKVKEIIKEARKGRNNWAKYGIAASLGVFGIAYTVTSTSTNNKIKSLEKKADKQLYELRTKGGQPIPIK